MADELLEAEPSRSRYELKREASLVAGFRHGARDLHARASRRNRIGKRVGHVFKVSGHVGDIGAVCLQPCCHSR